MSVGIRIAAGAAVGALALAGCGGGGDKTLSKSELDSKGNAICKAGDEKIAKVPQPSGLEDTAAVGAYFKAILPLGRQFIDDLEALKPPKDLKSDYDSFIASNRTTQHTVEQLITAADANDKAKVSSLIDSSETKGKATDAKATALGLTECAK